MAIAFSPKNYAIFFTALSPIFIIVYLIMDSAFYANIRSIVFIVGLLLAQMVGIGMRYIIPGNKKPWIVEGRSPTPEERASHDVCDVFEDPFGSAYLAPSTHAIFHSYTILYFFSGHFANPDKPGVLPISVLSIIAVLDLIFRKTSNCDNWSGLVWGIVIGGIIGLLYWNSVYYGWPGPYHVYLAKDKSQSKCKLKKAKFKCIQKRAPPV
jgi:hypothetical protein